MSTHDPIAGRELGHYRVLEKLGQGGMGVVWRALDTRLDRVVALKLVHPDLLADPHTRRRFLHEARAASAVTHPNVCTIHAIEEVGGELFLVLEYLEGSTLKERAPELRGSLKALLDVLIQAAEGLAEAHRRGVVHRDVKSANIWVTPRGQVKIVDFGLAKSKGAEPAVSDEGPTQEITLAGMTVGTVHYMSPEQALGRDVDPRGDIFSFGVVLYETLAGRLPFSGRTPVETFDQILHHDPTPPSAIQPSLPADVDRIALKALRKDPDERYQTAADLVVDLKALRRALESGVHPAHPGSSGSLPPAGSGAWSPAAAGSSGGVAAARRSTLGSVALIAAAMLAVVGLTLGGVAWLSRKPEAEPAAAAAAGRRALAVVGFENRTGDPGAAWYGENTADLLRVVLAQTGTLDVISKQRMYDVLREVRATGETPTLDAGVATEVARRSGAAVMVRGDVLRVAGSVVLTAEIVDVASGRVLGAERVTGVDEENMIEQVDELGRAIGARLEAIR